MTPRIVLTWDDGPIDDVPLRIVALACESGTEDVELYWCGAHLLRREVREALHVRIVHGVPQAEGGAPIDWMAWLDRERGRVERAAFVATLLDPGVCEMCRALRRVWGAEALATHIGYHGITHDPPDAAAHPLRLPPASLDAELRLFELMIQCAFEAPGYRLMMGRTPYGAGLPLTYQSPARRYERGFTRLDAIGRRMHPAFTWHAWDVDTKDYQYDGSYEEGESIAAAFGIGVRLSLERVRVLMHERCYARSTGALRRVMIQLAAQRTRRAATSCVADDCVDGVVAPGIFTDCEASSNPSRWWRFDAGPCWSEAEAARLLDSGRRMPDRAARIDLCARTFLRLAAPYARRATTSSRCVTRVTFEAFDGLSFVWTVAAMANAGTLDACAGHLRALNACEDGASSEPGASLDVVDTLATRCQIRNVTERLWMKAGQRPRDLWTIPLACIPIGAIGPVAPVLKGGDVILLLRRPVEGMLPDCIDHAVVVCIAADGGAPLALHATNLPLDRADGRRAGVSLATRCIPDADVLEDGEEGLPLAAFLQQHAARWCAAIVLRADGAEPACGGVRAARDEGSLSR